MERPLNARSITCHCTGIGVLELVDHHDGPALMHPQPARGSRRCPARRPAGSAGRRSRGCPVGACASPARRERACAKPTQTAARSRVAGRRAAARSPGCSTTSRASLQRVAVGQRRIVALLAEMGEVEVVDDLGDQVVEALDQRDAGSRCHRPRPATSAPAGRTGGWWRWSRRRSRPAHRAAAACRARRAHRRCRRAGTRPTGCRRRSTGRRKRLRRRRSGRGPARAAPGWPPGRT